MVAFQSTHPVWDATQSAGSFQRSEAISIHASRMGCDTTPFSRAAARPEFQSTHPVWDATIVVDDVVSDALISIHASRMGCDFGLLFHAN